MTKPITSDRTLAVLTGASILIVVGFGVLPILFALVDIARTPSGAVEALADRLMWQRFATTLGICGLTLAIALPVGMLQAWLLVRTDVPGRRALMMFTPFPLFLPPLVHVLSWFGVITMRGLPAIVLVYVISFMPFVVLFTARALDQIGRSHAETMRLIGGEWLVLIDDLRQALPMALIGGVLILVFILSDFAVADFLTSVGPAITVYGDTLYSHHLALRSAGAAGASLPGLVLCLALLLWALQRRRTLGTAIGTQHSVAEPVALGPLRWPLLGLLFLIVAVGSLLPLVALLIQSGSWSTIQKQFVIATDRVQFTVFTGAVAATAMVLLSLPLAYLASSSPRRSLIVDVLVFLPLAVPPLIFGIGLIRVWNHSMFDAIYLGSGIVIIAMVGRYLAFAYLPISGALERLDPAMTEAAQLSSASRWANLRTVLFPLIRNSVLPAWCIAFCFTLRELDTLIMLRAGQQSLPHHLYANVIFARQDEVAALALILAGVTYAPLLLVLALSRRPLRMV